SNLIGAAVRPGGARVDLARRRAGIAVELDDLPARAPARHVAVALAGDAERVALRIRRRRRYVVTAVGARRAAIDGAALPARAAVEVVDLSIVAPARVPVGGALAGIAERVALPGHLRRLRHVDGRGRVAAVGAVGAAVDLT